MEFDVITVQRSLDLSKNYQTVKAGNLQVGLQSIQDDVAEIEVQGPDGIATLRVPVATAVEHNGYTFICRDVGMLMPAEKKRRRFFGGGGDDDRPKDGIMEAVFDVRWGDQAMEVISPEKDHTYDFMLVRQYEVVKDRPMVYQGQDVLQFGDMRLKIGDRIEEGSRNWKKPRRADFLVQFDGDDEESWQIKLNGKYDREKKYRVRVTHYDWYNGWYQAYGVSIVYGRPKEEIEETDDAPAYGITEDAMADSGGGRNRLQEARDNPNEGVFKSGETKNIGSVGVKVMDVKPGQAKVMFLSPKIRTTTLVQGEEFDFGRFDVVLVGVYDNKAIIRVTPDDD